MLYAVLRWVVIPLVRLIYRPTVEGLENLPRRGPVIVASNHLSFADSLVIPLVSPRRVRFIAKTEYFEGRGLSGRLVRWFFTSTGAIPVRRDSQRAATASLETALSVLTAGDAFGIYPEGSRSPDGRLYRGRTGVGWLALTSRAPVVPVALIGTDQIQPVGSRLPRVRPVTVRFGAPMHFTADWGEAGSAQARRRVTDTVMAGIAELSGQECAGTYSRRPSAAA